MTSTGTNLFISILSMNTFHIFAFWALSNNLICIVSQLSLFYSLHVFQSFICQRSLWYFTMLEMKINHKENACVDIFNIIIFGMYTVENTDCINTLMYIIKSSCYYARLFKVYPCPISRAKCPNEIRFCYIISDTDSYAHLIPTRLVLN